MIKSVYETNLFKETHKEKKNPIKTKRKILSLSIIKQE